MTTLLYEYFSPEGDVTDPRAMQIHANHFQSASLGTNVQEQDTGIIKSLKNNIQMKIQMHLISENVMIFKFLTYDYLV